MVIQVQWWMHIVTHHLESPRPARNNKMLQHLSLPRQTLPLRLWKLPVAPAGVDRFSCICIYIYMIDWTCLSCASGTLALAPLDPTTSMSPSLSIFSWPGKHVFMGLPMHACCGKMINTSLLFPINSTFLKYSIWNKQKSWLHAIMSERSGSLHHENSMVDHRPSSGEDLPESLVVAVTLHSNACSSMYVDLYIYILSLYTGIELADVYIHAHI